MHMAFRLGNMVTYVEGLLTIKSYNALIRWSCKFVWQTKTTTTRMPTATKLGKIVTYLDGLLSRVRLKLSYLSTTTWSMTTKLDRMVTYLEGLLTIKPFNALITWYFKVTWKTKIIISPLPEYLWPPNLAGW